MNNDEGNLPLKEIWKGIEIRRPRHIDIADSLPHIMASDIKKWGRGVSLFSKIFTYNILSAHELIHELILKKGIKYDLVIAHDWLSAISGVTIKRELNIPLVLHIHSTEKGRTFGDGSEMVNNIEIKGGQIANRVITVSHAMKDELEELGFQREKIEVCYNGVDEKKYDPKKIKVEDVLKVRNSYGIGNDDPFLLFIGRLVPIKGVDKLIMAMPTVLDKVPNAKLVIVGVGDMESYLKRLVYELRIENSVKFCSEFLSEDKRILHYAACDLAVFPSLYEPFGIVALEAMSMEKTLVVGANGISGMRETVIPHGPEQSGFHVNPNEPRDIAWGILCALEDPERMKRMGKNSRKRDLKEFTCDTAVEKILNIYKGLLSRT
jgi:glycosyltransferase involved in cell wall biosynthesis